MKPARALAGIALLVAGCSTHATALDTGSADAGDAGDAGILDMGLLDSGLTDAGMADGGLPTGVAPSGRYDTAYAADPDGKKVYVVEGDKAASVQCSIPVSDFVDEAWAFDPSTKAWAQIQITSQDNPLKRSRAAGVWDAMRKRMIMFGGRHSDNMSGTYTFLNDVWSLDPSTGTWTQLSAQGNMQAPPGRMNPVMVAAPGDDSVIIFGGGTNTGIAYNDTWVFKLSDNSWRQIGKTGAPLARLLHVGALDPMHGRLYIFTGVAADEFTQYDDLWYLDLDADRWTRIPNSASFPDPRFKAAMQYDAARNRLVFFGGHAAGDVMNDVWTFDLAGQQWAQAIKGDQVNGVAMSCSLPANFATADLNSPDRREAPVFSIYGDQALLFSGETDCGIPNDTWILDLTSMTWTQINSSFSGLTCPRSGRTDCGQPNAQLCG
jgi:N-acetylneuraminic acid mutarotase